MGKPRPSIDIRESANFHCKACGHRFSGAFTRAEPVEGRDWLPFEYFSDCPECGKEADQAAWEVNLAKAHVNATGPTTPEGKAKAAATLAEHARKPEHLQITRFNALKHGAYAKVSMFFPARPNRYPECEGCEHLETEYCVPFQACLKKAELFIRYAAAFQSGDPTALRDIVATRQAALNTIIDQMILAIARAGGPELQSPEWYNDKDGGFHLARFMDDKTGEYVQLMKTEEHPLLKRLIEFIAKNNMALGDMGMTPKVQDEQETIKGYMDQEAEDREQAHEYRARLEQQQNALIHLIQNSAAPAPAIKNINQEGSVIDGRIED